MIETVVANDSNLRNTHTLVCVFLWVCEKGSSLFSKADLAKEEYRC